jgi:hypothetical protein
MDETIGKVAKIEAGAAITLAFAKLKGANEEERRLGYERLRKEFGEAAKAELKKRIAEEDAKPIRGLKSQSVARAPVKATGAAVVPKREEAPLAPASAPAAKRQLVRGWSEVVIPQGANDREKLTYLPGLVGDLVEWIVAGARRPNRMLALGVASVVIGTLIGRRIEGPTGSATHLFVILLAPTGYGKEHPLQAGPALMEAAGRLDLLGPQEWASAPGFINRLKRGPLMVCFVDELGDELSKINSGGGVWLTAMIGLLKKCYNAWDLVMTAEKVDEESERIDWPAPSIVGAATPERFFESLKPGDLESGFANRLLILPFEGCRRPPEQSPAEGSKAPPKQLIAGLKALPKQTSIGEQILNATPSGPVRPTREPIGWGAGAEETYLAFSRKLDALEDGDRQRYELSMRACENAARLATILAVGRGSRTVDREDIAWSIALASQSVDAACGGIAKYLRDYLEFPKFCDRVLEYIIANGGWASRRNLERDFRGKSRYGFEMQKALDQLQREERIKRESRCASRGPAADGYALVEEE